MIIASFSDFGADLEVMAPEVGVFSTYKNGLYATASGTSMATPHVSGTVALMLAMTPDAFDLNSDGLLSPDEIRNKLRSTAKDLGAFAWDQYFGHGRIDALASVISSKFTVRGGGTSSWTSEKTYRGNYSAKLTTLNGETDVGIIEIKVDIPLNQINSLSFAKFISSFTTNNWCNCGWNPNILLGSEPGHCIHSTLLKQQPVYPASPGSQIGFYHQSAAA